MNAIGDARMRLACASMSDGAKYVTVHPDSQRGNPNEVDPLGYEFVGFRPDGLMVYRRKSWLARVLAKAAKRSGKVGA